MEKLNEERKGVWNKDFILLWQGQLISFLGDVIYSFAIGFWVFEKTGSSGIMSLVTASAMVPRLLLGPVAGVWVDRWDRKKIIVLTDLIRGIIFTIVGVMAFTGRLEVWMVFIAGILSSICSSFFGPTISSVKPDLVDKDKIVKANSIFGLSQAGSNTLGAMASGVIYAFLGAPFMFLFDGISYLISAFTELFINVPKVYKKDEKESFKKEFKEGLSFVWGFKVFRIVVLIYASLNLFCNAGMILLVPLFRQETYLGVTRYGIMEGVASIGAMIGSLLLTVITIKPNKRYRLLCTSFIVEVSLFTIMPFTRSFLPILIGAPIAIGFNMIGNTLWDSVCMIAVPEDMRGKVFSLMETICMGLSPLGIIIGGVLGQIMPIRVAIAVPFTITCVLSLSLAIIRPIKYLVNFDPDKESIYSVMEKTNNMQINIFKKHIRSVSSNE